MGKYLTSITNFLSRLVRPLAIVVQTIGQFVARAFTYVGRIIWKVLMPILKLLGKLLRMIFNLVWLIIGPFVVGIYKLIEPTPIGKLLKKTGRYFKGSWEELGKVKWPTNDETWSMTGVVFAFTVVMILMIIAMDGIFGYILRRIIE